MYCVQFFYETRGAGPLQLHSISWPSNRKKTQKKTQEKQRQENKSEKDMVDCVFFCFLVLGTRKQAYSEMKKISILWKKNTQQILKWKKQRADFKIKYQNRNKKLKKQSKHMKIDSRQKKQTHIYFQLYSPRLAQ